MDDQPRGARLGCGLMAAADLSDYRWLISDAAAPWLALATDAGDPLPARAKRLRRDLTPSQTHLVLEQAELRRRATAKFSLAARMFFTPRSLQQATSECVGEWKSERLCSLAAGSSSPFWADLCCGMGGDLLSMARNHPTVGVERDEILAILAQANLAECGLSASVVRCRDVREASPAEFSAWHIDPDRRTARGRIAQPALAEPGIEVIDKLLSSNPQGAVKLAPAARAPESWTRQCELEWISERGECKQQVAWFGSLARNPARRLATILNADRAPRSVVEKHGIRPPVQSAVGRYVYEPDAAVLAAGLAGELAAEHELTALGSEVGYLTGDREICDFALAVFEVVETAPFDRKRLKAMLRARGVGRPEVKTRGIQIDVHHLQREVRGNGDEPGVILITPIAEKVTAIVARRIP
jgi:hypothetical protein